MTPPTQQDKPIDLEALRLAAEAASPGPWVTLYEGGGDYVVCAGEHTVDDVAVCARSRCSGGHKQASDNADYIALISPDTIFALLGLIDAQQKQIAALEGAAGFAADLGVPADGIGL